MDREACHTVVHGITKSHTQLSDWAELIRGKNMKKNRYLYLYQTSWNVKDADGGWFWPSSKLTFENLGTDFAVWNMQYNIWKSEKRFSFLKDWILYITFMKTYAKAFDCVNHNKLWEILKEMGIPDHLTCLLRNLYAGQEATVRTRHGKTDWFQIGKGVH